VKGVALMIKISVSIDVSNLKKAEAFYVRALGCKKVREQGSDMRVLCADPFGNGFCVINE
jgi:catechol 2,3-dioxygenase-like lactoylglutathione lyase family enzyme